MLDGIVIATRDHVVALTAQGFEVRDRDNRVVGFSHSKTEARRIALELER